MSIRIFVEVRCKFSTNDNNIINKKDSVNTQESSFLSTIKTKTVIDSQDLYDADYQITCIPQEMEMDFSRLINKPFFVDNVSYTTASTVQTDLIRLGIPSGILDNYLANVPFKSSCLFRMKACVLLQLSGTPMHQGLLLGAVTPTNFIPSYQSLLVAPHAFMNANESTPVCIEVPFYFNVELARTNCVDGTNGFAINDRNYAFLSIRVVNPLRTAASASTSLNVSIHFMVKEAHFYIPRNTDNDWSGQSGDFYRLPTRIFDGLAQGAKSVTGDIIDSARNALRAFTGFHNPNTPAINTRMVNTDRNFLNNVDQPTLLEKLDTFAQHDRLYNKPYFSTLQDEMDIQHILKKPQYVGSFSVTSTTPIGRLLFSQPITPMIEVGSAYSRLYSPMRILYEMSRYWRGSIKMHIQPVMTNFHFCKIVVVNDYTGDKRALTLKPNFNQIHNMITNTVEFSAGGQVQTIDLPFCSQLDQLECHKDVRANALSHGITYVYLMQPLVVNGSVPLTIDFNVYFTVGDDFQFYGYMVDPLFPALPNTLALRSTGTEYGDNKANKNQVSELLRYYKDKVKNKEMTPADALRTMRSKCMRLYNIQTFYDTVNIGDEQKQVDAKNDKVVNADTRAHSAVSDFQAQVGEDTPVTVGVSDQDSILNNKDNEITYANLKADLFKPMINVRDYVRRLTDSDTYQFTVSSSNLGVFQVPITSLFSNNDALSVFSTMFYGITGGLKCRIISKSGLNTSVYYVPPGSNFDPASINYNPANAAFSPIMFSGFLGYPFQARTQTVYVPPRLKTGINNAAQRGDLEITEFVIPNMNVCNFFTSPATGDKYVGSLGYIAIVVFSDIGTNVVFDLSVAAADELRLGFQAITTGVDIYRDNANARLSAYVPPGTTIPLTTSGAVAAYTRNAT